jgi:energy-coupling factor transporter ATP-binding protein EcfA2
MHAMSHERIGDCEKAPIIAVFSRILREFDQVQVSYCYWKSSARVSAALLGDTDLDLLVAQEDQHRASAILLGAGFKAFPAASARAHPSIATFLAHDEESGRLLHVDLHTWIALGDTLVKEYRLPWEHIILTRSVRDVAFSLNLLDPVSEAILLITRACLESRFSDVVALRNRTVLRQKFEADRKRLAQRVDRAELQDLAALLFPPEAAHLVASAIWDPHPLHRLRRLRRQMRRALAPFCAYGSVEVRIRSWCRAAAWLAGHVNQRLIHAPRSWNRRVPGGGRIIAVVGVDGSGKSTLVRALRAWLAPEVDVMPIYFGTGDGRPSLWLLPFKLVVPICSHLMKPKIRESSPSSTIKRPPGFAYTALMLVWATLVAIEKRGKLRKAFRASQRGMLVLTDRYPQNENIDFNDGPLLPRLSSAPAFLHRFEAKVYQLSRRIRPDLVLSHEISLETATRREPTMDRAVIERRIAELTRLCFAGARIAKLDSEQSFVDVVRAAKRELWRAL